MAHSSSSFTRNSMWTKMSDYAIGERYHHTVVAYKDAMYVFGGSNGNAKLNDLVSFDDKDKSWNPVHADGIPPQPRQDHSGVVFGNSMFIYGGCTSSGIQNDLFEYDFQIAMWVEWTFSGQMPVGRLGHGAAVYDNKMWIYAGYGKNRCLDDMWALNLTEAKHQWEKVEQMGERPPAGYYSPVAVARDCMYVFSGKSDIEITTSNSLFEFNFKTKTWRRIGNEHVLRGVAYHPPSQRYGHTLFHHDRFLYVFGGYNESSLNDLHCYDLDFQNWSIIKPEANSVVPSCRAFHSSIVLNDVVYIYGGRNSVYTVITDVTCRCQFTSYPKCTLRDDYGKFFSEKQFCDIKFIVGPEEIKMMAHIVFVAARSKYLRTKILTARDARQQQIEKELDLKCIEVRACAHGANQEHLEVRLPNANPEAFEIILNYIYTDRIDVKESYNKNVIILIADVHQLAYLFLMPRLASACIKYLDFEINTQNVLEGLCYADKRKIQIVKDHCMNFLIKEENFADVVKSKELSDLDKPLVVEVMAKKLIPTQRVADTNMDAVGFTLEKDMAVFLESTGRDFCDIKLVLDDQVIMAHKSILAARAQYFQGMFRSFMPPDSTVNISISDIIPSREAFQSLLGYIYYGDTKLPPQDALYLLQASHFYCLSNDRLHSICEYSLKRNITRENIFQTFEAADYTNNSDIKDHVLRLIVKNFASLPKISDQSHETVLEIIRAIPDLQSFNANT